MELKLIHCHLVKTLHFSHFLYTAPFITVEENIWIWVCFQMLFSVLFIHLYPWLYCSLNHCSFVVNFYVWDCKSLNLVLIQEYFSLCSVLYCYMNFRIRLSISIHMYTYKYAYKYCQHLAGGSTEFTNYLGENWHLYSNKTQSIKSLPINFFRSFILFSHLIIFCIEVLHTFH